MGFVKYLLKEAKEPRIDIHFFIGGLIIMPLCYVFGYILNFETSRQNLRNPLFWIIFIVLPLFTMIGRYKEYKRLTIQQSL